MTPDEAVDRRRPGAVRREIRRRGARRLDGLRRTTTSISRSSCAAARMSAAPAISACSRSSREGAVAAGVRRIEALTGDGARACICNGEEDRCCADGGGAARRRRRTCRPASPAWSRSGASSSASSPRRGAPLATAAAAAPAAMLCRRTSAGVKFAGAARRRRAGARAEGDGRRAEEAGRLRRRRPDRAEDGKAASWSA